MAKTLRGLIALSHSAHSGKLTGIIPNITRQTTYFIPRSLSTCGFEK
jgi:hypothetical protein